jgi:PAS domain S-box-containing protein
MPEASRRILIVEDDEAHAELIRRGFEDQGGDATLTVVRTVRQAREHLRESVPDLVITDLRLPDGDGAELIEPDRERAAYPVVVMTGFGDQKVAVDALRTGAIDYVVKSEVSLAEMARTAERALREWKHIVERRHAEQALRRSEEHFRSLIENALDLILLLDVEGRFRYASPSARRTLELEPEGLAGRTALDLVHPDDRELLSRAIRGALAQPGEPQFATLRLRSRGGEWRVFESIGQAQIAGQPEPVVVVNARDITERLKAVESRRELEAQLQQAQRLETLGTLAGGIAHDFNNILQAVMGCSELARNKIAADSPARRYLDRSLEVSRRGRDTVEQILQFSRRRVQKLETIELRGVVGEVVKLLRATFPAAIEIRERVEASGVVAADPSQIHQVLMNLATNARQAMAGEGKLGIALERLAPGAAGLPPGLAPLAHFVLSVNDSGPGIPAEVRQHIFEPFFTTKEVGEGTGLGLAVAHGIVKGHGGAILCESEPGHGATFRVYLPEARPVAAQAAAAAPTTQPRQARVLFVDADANVAFVGRSLLEGLGHQVTTAANGVQALELFSQGPGEFDLVIVDEAMPGMTGSQLSTELRLLRPGLPVIVASGQGLPGGALFSDDASVVYLRKPFDAAELSRALSEALAARG